jgi:hypothetical protein
MSYLRARRYVARLGWKDGCIVIGRGENRQAGTETILFGCAGKFTIWQPASADLLVDDWMIVPTPAWLIETPPALRLELKARERRLSKAFG